MKECARALDGQTRHRGPTTFLAISFLDRLLIAASPKSHPMNWVLAGSICLTRTHVTSSKSAFRCV